MEAERITQTTQADANLHLTGAEDDTPISREYDAKNTPKATKTRQSEANMHLTGAEDNKAGSGIYYDAKDTPTTQATQAEANLHLTGAEDDTADAEIHKSKVTPKNTQTPHADANLRLTGAEDETAGCGRYGGKDISKVYQTSQAGANIFLTGAEDDTSGYKNYVAKYTPTSAAKYKQGIEKITTKSKYWTPELLQGQNTTLKDRLTTQFASKNGDLSLLENGQKILKHEFAEKLDKVTRNAKLQNEFYLKDCEQRVSPVNAISEDIKQHLIRKSSSNKLIHEYIESFETKLRSLKDFDRLPCQTASLFLSDLSTRLANSYNAAWRKICLLKRKTILNQAKTKMHDISAHKVVHNVKSLMRMLKLVKENALTEFSTIFEAMQFKSGSIQEQTTALKKLKDFEDEVDKYIAKIMERNSLNIKALQDNIEGEYCIAIRSYTNEIDKINNKLYNPEKYLQLSNKAKDLVVKTFENACKMENSSYEDLTKFMRNLTVNMEKLPSWTRCGEDNIEIRGLSLNFSADINKLENATGIEPIQQINWIATEDITIDEHLYGEFWSGKNIVVCAPLIIVSGTERIIDVSGKKGNSAPTNSSLVPRNHGACGYNGRNGDPGESGGNVAIFAHEIQNAKNLCLISNGGAGGDGQLGGAGSDGCNGINGDLRFSMSLDELLEKFPSPARFRMALRTQNLDAGLKSLKEFANGKDIILKGPLVTESSIYSELTTSEGAVIYYAFFDGHRIRKPSFYVWVQGAPGTNGQPGGAGGHGGHGGRPGHSGNIHCPVSYKHEISVTNQESILSGNNGKCGACGKDGIDGKQGTDYAYLDTYAGWSLFASSYEIQKFSGNLNRDLYFARRTDIGASAPLKSGAFCLYTHWFITFVDSTTVRNVKVVNHAQQQVKQTAAAEPVMKKPIDTEYFKNILQQTQPAKKLKLELNTI